MSNSLTAKVAQLSVKCADTKNKGSFNGAPCNPSNTQEEKPKGNPWKPISSVSLPDQNALEEEAWPEPSAQSERRATGQRQLEEKPKNNKKIKWQNCESVATNFTASRGRGPYSAGTPQVSSHTLPTMRPMKKGSAYLRTRTSEESIRNRGSMNGYYSRPGGRGFNRGHGDDYHYVHTCANKNVGESTSNFEDKGIADKSPKGDSELCTSVEVSSSGSVADLPQTHLVQFGASDEISKGQTILPSNSGDPQSHAISTINEANTSDPASNGGISAPITNTATQPAKKSFRDRHSVAIGETQQSVGFNELGPSARARRSHLRPQNYYAGDQDSRSLQTVVAPVVPQPLLQARLAYFFPGHIMAPAITPAAQAATPVIPPNLADNTIAAPTLPVPASNIVPPVVYAAALNAQGVHTAPVPGVGLSDANSFSLVGGAPTSAGNSLPSGAPLSLYSSEMTPSSLAGNISYSTGLTSANTGLTSPGVASSGTRSPLYEPVDINQLVAFVESNGGWMKVHLPPDLQDNSIILESIKRENAKLLSSEAVHSTNEGANVRKDGSLIISNSKSDSLYPHIEGSSRVRQISRDDFESRLPTKPEDVLIVDNRLFFVPRNLHRTMFLKFDSKLNYIRHHVEYYFSDWNLSRDEHLKSILSSNLNTCPISDLLLFNRLRWASTTKNELLDAVSGSNVVTVTCSDGSPFGITRIIPPSPSTDAADSDSHVHSITPGIQSGQTSFQGPPPDVASSLSSFSLDPAIPELQFPSHPLVVSFPANHTYTPTDSISSAIILPNFNAATPTPSPHVHSANQTSHFLPFQPPGAYLLASPPIIGNASPAATIFPGQPSQTHYYHALPPAIPAIAPAVGPFHFSFPHNASLPLINAHLAGNSPPGSVDAASLMAAVYRMSLSGGAISSAATAPNIFGPHTLSGQPTLSNAASVPAHQAQAQPTVLLQLMQPPHTASISNSGVVSHPVSVANSIYHPSAHIASGQYPLSVGTASAQNQAASIAAAASIINASRASQVSGSPPNGASQSSNQTATFWLQAGIPSAGIPVSTGLTYAGAPLSNPNINFAANPHSQAPFAAPAFVFPHPHNHVAAQGLFGAAQLQSINQQAQGVQQYRYVQSHVSPAYHSPQCGLPITTSHVSASSHGDSTYQDSGHYSTMVSNGNTNGLHNKSALKSPPLVFGGDSKQISDVDSRSQTPQPDSTNSSAASSESRSKLD